MGVTIGRDNVAKVVKAIKELTSKEVLIGIPAEKAARDDGPITNAAIGFINEFGSPLKNILPRPHLVPGVQKAAPDAIERLQTAGKKALSGDISQIDVEFNKAGLICQTSVKQTITDVLGPPLKPATIAARRRKGHAGESPLIDTGEYLNHISYVIRDK